MRLKRIDLAGFGCLHDFRAEFAPGLNVFHGLNEAGKSTLQQGIAALLYGFYDGDRARQEETARHERFRPWDGGVYRGSLEYEIEDGRGFEVRRDFTTADVPTQLIDLFSGQDIASSFGRSRHGNVPFARRHLGMSRTVFRSCAFISQGEIFHVAENGPKEIADAVAALADTAGRDVSATKAIERLKTALSRIGSDRARTAELPKAREALAAVTEEIDASDEARRSLSARAAELDSLEEQLAKLNERAECTEYELIRCRIVELSDRVEAIERARESLVEANEAKRAGERYAKFPVDQRDEVLSLYGRWERAQESVSASGAALSEAEEAITPAERAEFEVLRTSVGGLSGVQIASLEEIAYARQAHWLVRALRSVAGMIVRGARYVLRLVLRKPVPLREDEESEALNVSREDALSLLERHRRYLGLAPAIERLAEAQSRLEAEDAALAAVTHRLVALFEAAGVGSEAGVTASFDAFVEACEQRESYERAAATAAEMERRTDLLLRGRTLEEIESELRGYEQRAAEKSGGRPAAERRVKGSSARDLSRELDQLREQRTSLELKAGRLREEVRLTMAQHRSRAELEEEAGHWEAHVAELERAREALRIAAQAIEEAMVSVYRDFAPAVNTFLSDGIERVTDGRYTRAHVDPASLSISLLVPETGQVITDPPVSHGTRTLAYVLMRIGLAQHMSAVGEPVPLILDDPFVDVDSERLPRMLDYLAELTSRIQVFIFTKDQAVLDWFDSQRVDGRHRLHQLSSRVPAATV
ncbi:MAG: ATP-binding protein [Dehalococcoidia bacterium]